MTFFKQILIIYFKYIVNFGNIGDNCKRLVAGISDEYTYYSAGKRDREKHPLLSGDETPDSIEQESKPHVQLQCKMFSTLVENLPALLYMKL